MCGILGVISTQPTPVQRELQLNCGRGRDSWGFIMLPSNPAEHIQRERYTTGYVDQGFMCTGAAIVNMRAEPTTEYILTKTEDDVQPYIVGDWVIVHNGTIANDKELCAEFGFEPPTRIDSWVIAALCDRLGFAGMLERIVGSYAILAININDGGKKLHYAVNYRPLYISHFIDDTTNSITLSSVQTHPSDMLLTPYTAGTLALEGGQSVLTSRSLYKQRTGPERALVVFSGGLDSTVAAAALQHDGYEVELLHFNYGARATAPELQAVNAVSKALGAPLHIVETSIFTDVIKGSRLTNTKDESFAEGEAGAEYAHEWVPARNLILTSIALGIAESRGFDVLALGANLEEAGAYPDNEPEFLKKFNQLIPFAVSDGKRIRIETPVGNLMKHEIVKLGLVVNAPMEHSWSCYDAQEVPIPNGGTVFRHCGHCGPCFMRKTAFQINGRVDPVFAAEQE